MRWRRSSSPRQCAEGAETHVHSYDRRATNSVFLPGGDDAGRSPAPPRSSLVAAFAAELTGGSTSAPSIREGFNAQPNGGGQPTLWRSPSWGDVPRVLHDESIRHELPILRSLAALWRVAEGSGAGLAEGPTASPLPRQLRNRRARKSPLNSRVRARRRRCLPGFRGGRGAGSGLGARPSHGWWDRGGSSFLSPVSRLKCSACGGSRG